MSHTRRLGGRKIAALAADGLEKIELVMPLRGIAVCPVPRSMWCRCARAEFEGEPAHAGEPGRCG
jgi:hypothetical protein